MRFKDLECLVRQWASDRGLFHLPDRNIIVSGQMRKLAEEMVELIQEIFICDESWDNDGVAKEIGDMQIVLTVLAFLHHLTLAHCFEVAYKSIKDRKGKMVNGVFVKDEPNCDESKITKPKCSECFDKGTVEYYYDCGDHFAAGTAPGSEWRTKPCPKCKGGNR